MNKALTSKVFELQKYRSEFFGKLQNILGEREDIKIVGDRFIFQSELLFDSASADLQLEGKEKLTEIGKTLKETTTQIPNDVDWIILKQINMQSTFSAQGLDEYGGITITDTGYIFIYKMTPKKYISMAAIKNFGIEMLVSAKPRVNLSIKLPGQKAPQKLSTTAIKIAKSPPNPTKVRVGNKRFFSSTETSSPVLNEYPRFPSDKSDNQRKYRSTTGSFNPYSSAT